mmetsp:Transcript_34207/g.71989  ORF Transcript_34207/g.71989 Transcript_34207/m.71989 type:complete len:226 (-) Transcript_34207:2556-3233(-)
MQDKNSNGVHNLALPVSDSIHSHRPDDSSADEKHPSKSFRGGKSLSLKEKTGLFFRKERALTEETVGELEKSIDVDEEDKEEDKEEAPEQTPEQPPSKAMEKLPKQAPEQVPEQAKLEEEYREQGLSKVEEPVIPGFFLRLRQMSASKARAFIHALRKRRGSKEALVDDQDDDSLMDNPENVWDEDLIEVLDHLEDGDEGKAIELILGEMDKFDETQKNLELVEP